MNNGGSRFALSFYRFQVSGFGCQGVEVLDPETSYETTIKANRRTAEYRISNVEGWIRFAQSFLKAEYIIRCSMFSSFFLDLTGRWRPAATLI
jgi:hypothetical protein